MRINDLIVMSMKHFLYYKNIFKNVMISKLQQIFENKILNKKQMKTNFLKQNSVFFE